MRIMEIAKQLVAKEFRDKNYKQRVVYIRYKKEILISFIYGANDYISVIIYKSGIFGSKFDFKNETEEGYKDLNEGLKNTLVEFYNYESIMNSIENKRKTDLQNFIYLANIIYNFSKIAGIDFRNNFRREIEFLDVVKSMNGYRHEKIRRLKTLLKKAIKNDKDPENQKYYKQVLEEFE